MNGSSRAKLCVADGDLALLHGLQQRALDLGRGPVDLVGQDDVGENRPFAGGEFAGLGIVDQGADEVRRQQVRGELDALEGRLHGFGQGGHRQGLGQPGHPFDEHMIVAQKGQQKPVHQVLLPHDDFADLGTNTGQPLTLLSDLLTDLFNVKGHRTLLL